MLVNGRSLGFSESDEVDDVREDSDQPVVCRAQEVGEGEVVDAALSEQSARPTSSPVYFSLKRAVPPLVVSLTRHKTPSSSACLEV